MTYFRKFCIFVFLALMPHSAFAQEGVLTVTGQATIAAAPDIATIRLGVTTQSPTAKEAIAQNSAQMTKVVARLKDMGIDTRDLQTSNFSVNPIWERYDGKRNKVSGYEARNQLAVIVRDLDALGAILDQVASYGANEFNGLQFGLNDSGAADDAALEAAIKDAARKAELMAQAAGIELAGIKALSQGGSYAQPKAMAMDRMVMAEAVPIESGELGISSNVTIQYFIAE